MSSPKKILYSFSVYKEVDSEIREPAKDANGNDIEVVKKIKERLPIEVVISKPSKRQMDEATFEYGKYLNKMVADGFLTRAMLAKKYSDTGGALSQDQAKYLNRLYFELDKIRDESIRLGILKEGRPELQKDWEELRRQDAMLRSEILDIESSLRNLFQHTADAKAETQTILWFALQLTNIKEDKDKEMVPYFKGDSFDKKLEDYYLKEEDEGDGIHLQIRDRLFMILGFWWHGGAQSPEDFQMLEEELNKEVSPKEEAPVQETKSQ